MKMSISNTTETTCYLQRNGAAGLELCHLGGLRVLPGHKEDSKSLRKARGLSGITFDAPGKNLLRFAPCEGGGFDPCAFFIGSGLAVVLKEREGSIFPSVDMDLQRE